MFPVVCAEAVRRSGQLDEHVLGYFYRLLGAVQGSPLVY